MGTVITTPFEGQQAGTSGLRKAVNIFSQPHYLENYVQSLFNCLPHHANNSLVLGGDGRFYNSVAINTVLRMAAANAFNHLIVGQHGYMSTPAASNLVRKHSTRAAIVLTASHNPGGRNGDFGIKFNLANGGAAPLALTNRIHEATQKIESYDISDSPAPDLTRLGSYQLDAMRVTVIDPVSDYVALMQELFDFDAIQDLRKSGFRLLVDCLHGVTGPYAKAIFVDSLGFPETSIHGTPPLEDFGGRHPDPNPVYAGRFLHTMLRTYAPDFGAAFDSDGDRHMVMGRKLFITPSDSLAILTHYLDAAPGYVRGPTGVARSMATSTAVDRVAAARKIPVFETPTGWKYFCNLLDTGRITVCGEESAGAGSTHIREKDGIWAVLLWLNILARTGKSPDDIVASHWQRYGRTYYERRDYEDIEADRAHNVYARLGARLPALLDRHTIMGKITHAGRFDYADPVDGSIAENQGLRIQFEGGERVAMRLSGTGTTGATLRVYGERHDARNFSRDVTTFMEPLMDLFDQIAGISPITGHTAPSLIT